MLKILLCSLFCFVTAAAQEQVKESESSNWELNGSVYMYFIPDDFFVLPTVKADKDVIHLEARYNYEDRKTFSGWLGYNINTGEELEVNFTPMAGFAAGQTNGLLPGFELDLLFNKLEFYSEAEYLFNFDGKESDFFYASSELTYSPEEWYWIGIAGQRTRAYQTSLDIQTGFTAGAAHKDIELTGYLMNPFQDELFFIFSISVSY